MTTTTARTKSQSPAAQTPAMGKDRFGLPLTYRTQPAAVTHDDARAPGDSYWAPWRLADNRRYQRHVYAWAAELMRERGLRSVIDIGCGPGVKLRDLIAPECADITGVDQRSALAAARRHVPQAMLVECDLERPDLRLGRAYDLVICADVIEHMSDPDPLMELVRACAGREGLVLISTPERDRERGRACMGSDKPEHVREWSMPEFAWYLGSRGLTILAHRLLPKDDAAVAPLLGAEVDFALGLADRSPLCCQAVLCRVAGEARGG